MKPDILFLIIVISVGAIGMFINTNSSHEYLEDIKKPNNRVKGEARVNSTSRKVVVDEAIGSPFSTKEVESSSSVKIESVSSNQIPRDLPAEAAKLIMRWNTIFDVWSLVLEENFSEKTEIDTIKNKGVCSVEMGRSGQKFSKIELDSQMISRDGSTVYLNMGELRMNNLFRPMAVMSSTMELVKFCENLK